MSVTLAKGQSNSILEQYFRADSPERTALIPQSTQLFETGAHPASGGRSPPHTAQYKTQGHIAAIFQHWELLPY